MKKILLISVLCNVVLIMGATFPSKDQTNHYKKSEACGYTIVEFGKGVNCHGDTILLKRKHGVQTRFAGS